MWECTFLFNYDTEEVLTDTYVLYLCLCKRLSAESQAEVLSNYQGYIQCPLHGKHAVGIQVFLYQITPIELCSF
jgi:hypothetical protein